MLAFGAIANAIANRLLWDPLLLLLPYEIRPCFMGGYIPEERLKSRHAGKFWLTGAFRDDRDDIDDIFGNGIFIVLNVTIVILGCIANT